MTRRDPSRRAAAYALGVTAVAALGLRAAGLGYGLPAVYNPDEVAIMTRALALGQNGMNPHNFLYPSLYFYVLFAWEGAAFVIGRLAGLFPSLAAFERSFFLDPSAIYLIGRTLTAICGTLTVVATGTVGRRLFGTAAGLAAAIFLASAPLAVLDGHYVKHDVPVTLLLVVTVLWLARLLTNPALAKARWSWVVAGALAGAAMSMHYYAVFVSVPVALAAMVAGTAGVGMRAKRVGLAGVTAAACFFAGSPFLLVEPGTAWHDVVANRQIVVDRVAGTTGAFGSAGFYIERLSHDAAGTIVFLMALAGAGVALRRDWRVATVIGSFPVVFLLFISNTFPASRYLNPVVPFVALFAGAFIGWLWTSGGVARTVALALAAAAIIEAGAASVRTDRFIRQTDTRTLAADWMAREIPDGASVLIQPYSVPLRASRAGLVEALTAHLGSPSRASIKFQQELALDPYPHPAYRTIYLGAGGQDVDKIYVAPTAFDPTSGLGPLRALGIEFVVLKTFAEPDPSLASLRAALPREATLLASFSPERDDLGQTPAPEPFIHDTDARIDPRLARPGPGIQIWRIR